jgi:D-3-phosphoglycerate dehydrogenase / 2-oxoglutarate reductase
MKQKILIVQPIHERGVRVFDDRFEVRVASDPSVATVIREIEGVEGVVVRTAPFPREIIDAAKRLKVIGRQLCGGRGRQDSGQLRGLL